MPHGGFYINYEECKYFIGLGTNDMSYGFILTMRNVNSYLFKTLENLINSFILTMKNVNDNEKLSRIISIRVLY